MFAAMMAGGTFTFPRLTTSPATYTESGSATVQFSPKIGTTSLTIACNAGGGTAGEYNPPFTSAYDEGGGGQGARATGIVISCVDNDNFELTFVTESGRGKRLTLKKNGSTVLDLKGGENSPVTGGDGGDGGDALTPSVSGGTGGTGVADAGSGASTSYSSGTVYSGQGGWYAGNQSAAWIAYRDAEWPDYDNTNIGGFKSIIINGPGGGSNQDTNSAEAGYGGTQTETTEVATSNVTYNMQVPDIARMVITF